MITVSERFAALESEVEAVLHRQKTDPYIPLDQTATMIAGFKVSSPERKAQIIQQITKRMADYATAKAALLDKVHSLGVEPLAALPSAAWKNICRVSRLHRPRIYPMSDGGNIVRVDAKSFSKLIEKISDRIFSITGLTFCISSPIISFYFLWNFLSARMETGDRILVGAVISVIIFVLTICLTAGMNRPVTKMLYRLVARYYLRFRWDKILKMILAREDMPSNIKLPNPPQDVQDILLKINPLNPQVAAVANAIRFPDLIREAIDLIPEPLPVDPIIYIEENGVVVIVAQFGNFPIERDVVKRLSADEILK